MDQYDLLAELLKAMGHPVRLRILDILRDGEKCVCHLEAVLGLRQAYVSQQLIILRKAGLVTDRKDGLRVYYRITDHAIIHLLDQAQAILKRQGVTFVPLSKLQPANCSCPDCAAS